MTTSEAAQILGVTLPATIPDIKRTWRQMVMRVHPDHGGDPAAFGLAHAAYKQLIQEVEHEEATCQSCRGQGHITRHEGFFTHTARCHACDGSGRAAGT